MERLNQNTESNENLANSQAKFFRDLKLWELSSFEKYKFRLSTEKLILSPNESNEMTELAQLISGQNGFLEGALKLYKATLNPQFVGKVTGGTIRKILTTNLSAQDLEFINSNLESKSFMTRLDLVKVKKQNHVSPNFQIVEIEADKTHAFGYVTFPKLFRNTFLLEKNQLGIINAFVEELNNRKIEKGKPIILFLNKSENFYLKELTAFSVIAKRFDINLEIAEEKDIEIKSEKICIKNKNIDSNLLVSIPRITPSGIYGTGFQLSELLNLYRNKKIEVLIPPYRFLGAKGLLGIFKNTLNDPDIEIILEQTFGKELLKKLRPFIPDTINVTKRNKNEVLKILESEPDDWVIKEISTSGMRGVSLPGQDEEKRKKMLIQIIQNPFNFIIQRKVEQQTGLFTFSEPEKPSFIKQAEMYMRISPFVGNGKLFEIGLTAREQKSVHGSTDSIQIPVIF